MLYINSIYIVNVYLSEVIKNGIKGEIIWWSVRWGIVPREENPVNLVDTFKMIPCKYCHLHCAYMTANPVIWSAAHDRYTLFSDSSVDLASKFSKRKSRICFLVSLVKKLRTFPLCKYILFVDKFLSDRKTLLESGF